MSSSSSDSDSDDFEPMRRIKINIKPKNTATAGDGADVEAIKASVEAWRPLGPRPHPSLSRRQSSLSSVSSLSLSTANQNIMHAVTNIKPTTRADSSSANTNQIQYYYQSSSGTTKGNMLTNHNYTSNSIRSSPSCSSLVNEFSNRSSFSNFMPNASRTSSPLTFMNCNHSDTVPIALAIQESIELIVKGQHRPAFNGFDAKTQFETRALGNIKVAFPNTFARLCSQDAGPHKDQGNKQIPALKLSLHSTENIIRYYASGLIKDLDSERSSLAESVDTLGNESNNNNNNHCGDSNRTDTSESRQQQSYHQRHDFEMDLFDMNESPTKNKSSSKIIEFDMVALTKQLKQLYDQSPNMRYYNVDVLRYQIAPIDQFEKCPLQVCAYWKLESKLVKLRLDFKHSNQSGINLERLREISFVANLNNLVPLNLSIKPVLPNEVSTLTRPSSTLTNDNNNLSSNSTSKITTSTSDGNDSSYPLFGDCNDRISTIRPTAVNSSNKVQSSNINNLIDMSPTRGDANAPLIPHTNLSIATQPQPAPRQLNNLMQMKIPPPPSSGHSRHHHKQSVLLPSNLKDTPAKQQSSPFIRGAPNNGSAQSSVLSMINSLTGAGQNQTSSPANQPPLELDRLMTLKPTTQQVPANVTSPAPPVPYITFEPQAIWDDQAKQLMWKFDNLLAFYKNDGSGSLLAKLDFRHCDEVPTALAFADDQPIRPQPIDIKFVVVDSTLSKISLTIDSTGYRMSLLKKEVRSGRYKSEPCTF